MPLNPHAKSWEETTCVMVGGLLVSLAPPPRRSKLPRLDACGLPIHYHPGSWLMSTKGIEGMKHVVAYNPPKHLDAYSRALNNGA